MAGGGMKALIYLGFIKACVESKVKIHALGGLSGGAIIAGLLGNNIPIPEIIDFVTQLKFRSLFDHNPFDGIELLDHHAGENTLRMLLGDRRVEDSPIPILIFATNVQSEKIEVLHSGDLVTAIMASCALPPVFLPYQRGGNTYIDGGFAIHYGANFFRKAGCDRVIGIDVDGFTNVGLPGAVNNLYKAFSITQHQMNTFEQLYDPVDYMINDVSDSTPMLAFQANAAHLVDVGYSIGLQHIPQILRQK